MALVSDEFILIRISFPNEIARLNGEILQTNKAQVAKLRSLFRARKRVKDG